MSMIVKNLDVKVKRYILLHATIDSMVELERATKFYNANIKILNFAEKGKDHANPYFSLKRREREKGRKRKGQGRRQRKGERQRKEKENERGKERKKGKERKRERATTVRVRVKIRAAALTSLRSPRSPTSTPTSSATIAMRWDIFRISVQSLRCLSLSLREPRLQSPSCLQLRLTFLRDVPCILWRYLRA